MANNTQGLRPSLRSEVIGNSIVISFKDDYRRVEQGEVESKCDCPSSFYCEGRTDGSCHKYK